MSETMVAELPPSSQLWSIREAAERLGVSERYVWQLIADGVLRKVKLGRRTMVRDDDLIRYIASHTEDA
jgi:excisionase family DNA binding protein